MSEQVKQKFEEAKTQVLNHPSVQQAINWYQSQNKRDQLIIKALSAFVVICLIIVLFIQPMYASRNAAEASLERSLKAYELLAENAHKFTPAKRASGGGGNSPIMSTVTSQARQQGFELKRVEPDNTGLRVWLDNVPFDSAIRWLEELTSRHGIQVAQINVDKSGKPGRVNLRATLTR